MKRRSRTLIYGIVLTLFLSVFSNTAMANYKFFHMVQHVCKVYQIDVSLGDMNLDQSYDSNLHFELKLKAGRNNFDTVLMVGFIATGKALENNQDMNLEGVNITLTFAGYDNNIIIASASANDVVRLVRGDISAATFKKEYLTII